MEKSRDCDVRKSSPRRLTAFFGTDRWSAAEARTSQDVLCRGNDRRLAILDKHQRSSPKLPYQALVIRQSANLLEGIKCHESERRFRILALIS